MSAGLVIVEVGFVLSNVTDDESVVDVTCVPAFPAQSEQLIVNATVPSVSVTNIVWVADQDVGPPVTEAEAPAIVTVGVETDSDEVNVRVTVSPVLA